MKKQKINKLSFKKQVVSMLDSQKVVGGLAGNNSSLAQRQENERNEVVYIKKCCYQIPPTG